MEYDGKEVKRDSNSDRIITNEYHAESTDEVSSINIKVYIEPTLRLGWTF